MSSENSEKRGPSSEELIDLHVSVVPPEYWNQKLNYASQRVIEDTVSAGFVRVHPGKSIASLRQVISDQIGDHLFSTKYVFLKHVGRCLAMVNEKQEIQLKARNFFSPQNTSSEIFILPSLPSDYNQQDLQPRKFTSLGGKSHSRSEIDGKFFDENDREENSLISAQFASQRSQLTPVRQSNSTERWQHEIPDRTIERFVSGKSAAGRNDALQAGDDSSSQGHISSQQKHHVYEQQSSGLVSPQRQSNTNGPESHLSYNESTPSNDFDKSQRSKQRMGDNLPITDQVFVNKEETQHSSPNSAVFSSNPSRNRVNPSEIQRSEFAGSGNVNPYNDAAMNEKRAYLDGKLENYNHEYNNTQMTYTAETYPSQPPLQTIEKNSLSLPITGARKSGIEDEMSPVSYTEHTPQSDIQHVQYVKKNNDSGFIDNPHDFDDENPLETRRSKLSSRQKQGSISHHNTPQIAEEHEGQGIRYEVPAKVGYRQTDDDSSHFLKERNHTPEWGENTSEYSVRDSETSSMPGKEFHSVQRYSSRKSENTELVSNETPYHYANRQKLNIESESGKESQESNQHPMSSHKMQKSELDRNGNVAGDHVPTRRRKRSFVSFGGEATLEQFPQAVEKESVSDESAGRRRKQQFVGSAGGTEDTYEDMNTKTLQKESVTDDSSGRRPENDKQRFVGLVGETGQQQNPLSERRLMETKEGHGNVRFQENMQGDKFSRNDNGGQNYNDEEFLKHNVEISSRQDTYKQYSENNEKEVSRHEKYFDRNNPDNQEFFENGEFTKNGGGFTGNDRKEYQEKNIERHFSQSNGEYSKNPGGVSSSINTQLTAEDQASRRKNGPREFSGNLDEGPNALETLQPADPNQEMYHNELNPVLLLAHPHDQEEYSEIGQKTTINKDDSKYAPNSDAFTRQTRNIGQNDAHMHLENTSTNDVGPPQNNIEKRLFSHQFSQQEADSQMLSNSATPEKGYNDKENISEFLPHRGHPDGMPVQFATHVENEMNHGDIVLNVEKTSQGRTATPVPKPVFKPSKDHKQKIVPDNLNALDESSGSSSRTTTIKTSENGHIDYDMMETEDSVHLEIARGSAEDSSEAMQKRQLYDELQKMREKRMNFERQRQDLVKKAKNTAQQISHRRGAGRDVWKRRYFNEKKKTASLTDLCERLNHQHDSFRKKWPPSIPPASNSISNEKASFLSRTDERPSIKSNSKIQATRTLMSIEDLKKRLNDAKLRLTGEVKMRHEAEQELKNMKQGLLAKKIQSHVAYRKMNRFRGYLNSQNAFYNQSPRGNNTTFHARLR